MWFKSNGRKVKWGERIKKGNGERKKAKGIYCQMEKAISKQYFQAEMILQSIESA